MSEEQRDLWLAGIRIVPDERAPEGMIATVDEDDHLIPLGFITELARDDEAAR